MRKLLLNPTPLFRKLRQLSMLLTLLLALPQTAWGKSYITTGNVIDGTGNNAGTLFTWETNATETSTWRWVIHCEAETVTPGSTLTFTLPAGKNITMNFGGSANSTNADWSKLRKFTFDGLSNELTVSAALTQGGNTYNFTGSNGVFTPSGDTESIDMNGVLNVTITNNSENSVTCTINSITVLTGQIISSNELVWPTDSPINELTKSVSNNATTLSGNCAANTFFSFPLKRDEGNNTLSNLDSNYDIAYSSSNTNVAEVSGGNVTIKGYGSTTITATLTENDYYSYEQSEYSYTLTNTESYGLTIAGTAVTSVNASAITGTGISGTVSFDGATNTLTLNGAAVTGAIEYSGSALLNIAINGTNSVTNTGGTYGINASGQGTVKFIKATGASSAELTIEAGNGAQYPISATNPTLGSGLYWKPTAQNIMVITEDHEFVIVGGLVITGEVNGDEGTITYNSNDKTLTLNTYQKDFGASHAIKTGVTGLKVKLIGASTINCSADSAVFHAFSSSASIQFIKDDATSKLTMTGTDFENFATNSITYDGLFHYPDNTNKIITQAAAPVLSKQIKNDGSNNSYTYVTIDYAASDKSGSDAIYAAANPELKYSFDYADSQKQDVSDQTYPAEGIKMTDPGILTAWVEVGTYKGPEAKGVRFGFIENPFKMEFNGTAKQISITPAPTMTNAVTPSVNSDYTTSFNSFATLDATNNKITINSCYDGMIGFTFTNTDAGYTSLNDTTKITFNVTPPKPTISVPGGTYDAAQTVSIVSNYQGTGATIKYYFDPTAEQTYSADLSITTTQTLTAWVEVNGVKSDTVQAPYTIRQAANLSYSATTATAKIQASGTTFTAPTLNNPSSINDITYSSSNEQVATISNTGDVTILGAGTTTISAKATDETIYTPTPASYVLTVTRNIINPFSNVMEGQNFATYYNHNENLALPEGLTAYIVTGVSGTTVTITATGYLPKDVPLLLEKTGELAESLEMNGYSGEAGNFSSNKLKYATNDGIETTGNEYVLYMNEFVKATDYIYGACYLDLTGVSGSRGMYGIGGDGSTGIQGIGREATENGQWYDLQGRRIQQPTKAGIYIVNGKKVIINKK